jgi:holin-like protein
MIHGLAVLLICQLLGEGLARMTGAPVPGPVIGVVLLLCALAFGQRMTGTDPSGGTRTAEAADGLLRHLGLLFVPAGVGIVQHLDLVARHGVALTVALLVSTLTTLIVSVAVFRWASAGAGEERP